MPAQENRDNYTGEVATPDEALERNLRELTMLANFYHNHGFDTQAKEIYQSIVEMRERLNPRKDVA